MEFQPQKRKRSSPSPGDTNLAKIHDISHQNTITNYSTINNGAIELFSSIKIENTSSTIAKAPTSKANRSSLPTQKRSSIKSEQNATPKTTTNKKRGKKANSRSDKDDTDITSHMHDPPDDINLREIQLPKTVPNVKQPYDLGPIRGGSVLNLDAEQNLYYEDEVETRQPTIDESTYIIVPSYASWFDHTTTNIIERRALPEFFNSTNKSKTPEVYISYRNFIIDTYRLNPMEYLSVTTCRRNLSGDVCAIMRLHAFLEQWSLINYQLEPDYRPIPMGPPAANHFHVLVDTVDNGLKPACPNGKVNQNGQSASLQLFDPKNRETDSPDYDDLQRSKMNSFGLRLEDYAIHNLNFQSRGAATIYRDWSEGETSSLLEAIELYKDDWNKVCEHVGGHRTQDECILHFLRLPIEDPFLAEDGSAPSALDNQPIPFSKSGNPIMSTVAFLASVVDPRIAAAAAKAALRKFSNFADKEGSKEKPLNQDDLSAAAACALSAAAVRAKHLASIEERKIKSLVTVLIDTQLKKLNIKMKHYEELETLSGKERTAIESQKQQLLKDRQEFQMEQVRLAEKRAEQLKAEASKSSESAPIP